jgi:hypothetical protein
MPYHPVITRHTSWNKATPGPTSLITTFVIVLNEAGITTGLVEYIRIANVPPENRVSGLLFITEKRAWLWLNIFFCFFFRTFLSALLLW